MGFYLQQRYSVVGTLLVLTTVILAIGSLIRDDGTSLSKVLGKSSALNHFRAGYETRLQEAKEIGDGAGIFLKHTIKGKYSSADAQATFDVSEFGEAQVTITAKVRRLDDIKIASTVIATALGETRNTFEDGGVLRNEVETHDTCGDSCEIRVAIDLPANARFLKIHVGSASTQLSGEHKGEEIILHVESLTIQITGKKQ